MSDISKEKAIEQYGIDPTQIGNRHRGFWIIDEIESEELNGGANIGDLCVKARDGASNPVDMEALKIPNCIGTSEDGFDRTYRYYYFTPK